MFALRRLATTASRAAGRPAASLGLTRAVRPQSLKELRIFESVLQQRWNTTDAEGMERPFPYRQVASGRSDGAEQNRAPLSPTKVLYVGNLKYECAEQDLLEKFSEFGTVKGVRIPKTTETGIARGFGYVEFGSLTEAAEAIDAMHMAPFHGRRLNVQYVNRADMRIKNNPESKTLFIGNLSFNTTDEDLNELFKDVAGCIDVRVAMDRRTGQPRGFVHADFADVSSAVKAREQLTGTQLYGRTIRIDFSVPPEERKKQFEDRRQREMEEQSGEGTEAHESAPAEESTEKPYSS